MRWSLSKRSAVGAAGVRWLLGQMLEGVFQKAFFVCIVNLRNCMFFLECDDMISVVQSCCPLYPLLFSVIRKPNKIHHEGLQWPTWPTPQNPLSDAQPLQICQLISAFRNELQMKRVMKTASGMGASIPSK